MTAQTLRPIIVTHISRASYLMTDDAAVYTGIGREFNGHESVNHGAEEYVRAGFLNGCFATFGRKTDNLTVPRMERWRAIQARYLDAGFGALAVFTFVGRKSPRCSLWR